MKEIEAKIKQNIKNRIDTLRLELNEVYETQGHTKEVVKMSQELDKYIFFAQREAMRKSGDE
ncbi:MAG: aspartyl-phosphate phosphatase Spo0E family protein [Maledivibacter sp.]|jgi:FtsZ-binding cell division protein ZapB|nr:aspartyl-phosphate phosphatase Spo0E family protein [Maledivibacter sp.]